MKTDEFDMAIGDITVNSRRVERGNRFLHSNLSYWNINALQTTVRENLSKLLYKLLFNKHCDNKIKEVDGYYFLEILNTKVWIALALAYLVVSVAMYIILR